MTYLIVSSDFYPNITRLLLQGATQGFQATPYEMVTVAGALEIPAAINFAAAQPRYLGFVALGCVVRGQTSHYDIVCEQSAYGLQKLALERSLAIANGILTVDTQEQALARAFDKGAACAAAAVQLAELKRRFA